MSIRAAIESAVAAGRLEYARPVVPWAGEKRVFLMCRPVCDAIANGKASPEEKIRARWAALMAGISHFIEGGFIDETLVKQLDPAKFEHWELRHRKPRPSLRVFGRFAEPDVFVATHIEERSSLGGKWALEWELAKLTCEDHWRDAGLPDSPYSDAPDFRYESYITENARRQRGI